jgi:hypothetical protein
MHSVLIGIPNMTLTDIARVLYKNKKNTTQKKTAQWLKQ